MLHMLILTREGCTVSTPGLRVVLSPKDKQVRQDTKNVNSCSKAVLGMSAGSRKFAYKADNISNIKLITSACLLTEPDVSSPRQGVHGKKQTICLGEPSKYKKCQNSNDPPLT